LRDDFDREIVFDVVVEEEKTKRRQNNTNSIMVYKHPYKLELGMHTPQPFSPQNTVVDVFYLNFFSNVYL
jgi:hypothetical protein